VLDGGWAAPAVALAGRDYGGAHLENCTDNVSRANRVWCRRAHELLEGADINRDQLVQPATRSRWEFQLSHAYGDHYGGVPRPTARTSIAPAGPAGRRSDGTPEIHHRHAKTSFRTMRDLLSAGQRDDLGDRSAGREPARTLKREVGAAGHRSARAEMVSRIPGWSPDISQWHDAPGRRRCVYVSIAQRSSWPWAQLRDRSEFMKITPHVHHMARTRVSC